MPTDKVFQTNPDVFEKEGLSSKRELYIENQESAELIYEFHNEEALLLFNKLPEELLPNLPYGYQWVIPTQNQNSYTVVKNIQAQEHELRLVIYGPDNGKINYIIMSDT